ncbi:MAG: type IX secretion system membrane protein PorP/SprF [Draconibacterium sp.]|nr:type IX secretion system membrane protein PorP/SprF [Draconibacterium sp.]
MRLAKKILSVLIVASALFVFTEDANAQQDAMYTQYMDNLLVINPAFAGSKEIGNLLMVSRTQWVSFDGAPKTFSFSYNTALKENNIGLGFSVLNDIIGPQKQTGVYFDYSHFFQVSEKFRLGMGLKVGVSFYRAALTELDPINPDPIFSNDIYENFLPNLGIGFYLFSDDTYFGLSVPKLIRNTINRDDYLTEHVQRQEIHIYFVAGKQFSLSENVQLKTNTMLRYVQIAPVTWDVTAMFGFKEQFWVGGMFRLGDSYGILAQFYVKEKIRIGYSYDITYSVLNTFNNGTHEIMFGYNFDIFR